MTAEFSLNLLPINRLQGQENAVMPGLLVVSPPKRTARGREQDALLIYLTLSGNTTLSTSEYNQIVTRATQSFFKTSGALTSAIRNTAGELNKALLNRNLHTTGKGEYIIGRLILGSLRGTQFVFAQCGPTHVFHLSSAENRQIHDEQIAGRGLGVGQATPLYFSQIDLHAGDLLVMVPNLPAGYDAVLLGEKNASLESARRSLMSLPGDDLSAVLAQVEAGDGSLTILKELPASAGMPAPVMMAGLGNTSPQAQSPTVPAGPPGSATTEGGLSSHVESELPASRFNRLLNGAETSASSNQPGGQASNLVEPPINSERPPANKPVIPTAGRPVSLQVESTAHPVRRTGLFGSARPKGKIPKIKRPISPRRRQFYGGLARMIREVRGGTEKISHASQKLNPNQVPNTNGETEIAGSSMALFAIIIPVVIVAIAATVYIHYGRTAQYRQNYDIALQQAAQARGLTNPTDVRRAWDSTIYYLDLADKNQQTQDSINLRQEAQTALDNLDGILRLDFRPAIIGGLSRTVQITRMAATDTDLYMLDASRGAVMRAFLSNQSYEVDPSFQCAPGVYGTVTVDALVDLEVLPTSNIYNARVMAMDGNGDLLYCGLADPTAIALVPPQLGWHSISAFSFDSDGKNLYVLDPAGAAIWQYSGSFGQFPDLPVLFFGDQVPQGMNNAIDLAANDSDLYILFQDGHVTACPQVVYDVAPMRCADPAQFVDTRPERQSGPKINDAIFSQIAFASAPDPSLYLLEPLTRAIYRFSPRSDSLELRGQFRASMEQSNTVFSGAANSMTISSSRYAFFSVDNQVYFATDVP